MGKHLNLIKDILKDKIENTLTNDNLSGMAEDAILREFIKFENPMSHGLSVQNDNKHKQKLEAVFKLFGTELST